MPISRQIDEGINFFERKRHYLYLAYFQSYTNTHTTPSQLYAVLSEAVNNNRIAGIIVSTRPDCIDSDILNVLKTINSQKPLSVEFGVESTLDRSLELLNRGHNYAQVVEIVNTLHYHGIETGVHLILGIPNETRSEIVNHATTISKLPVKSVKLHQLQVVKNTRLAEYYRDKSLDIQLISSSDYVDLCADFVEHLRPDIAIERFASQTLPELLEVSVWQNVKNHHITHQVQNKLIERNTYQGVQYKTSIND